MAHSIHRRNYDCEVFEESEGLMRVRGHLNDTKPLGLGLVDGEPLEVHDMTIDLLVTVPGFEIIDVESRMDTHPYLSCTSVLGDYRQLIGTSITRGYSRRVKELFGGPNGCSHMGALLQALGPVAIQASWSLITLHEDPADRADQEIDQAERERRVQMNTNTCHVWAEDGEQLRAVASGGTPRRPAWEQDRLIQLGVDVGEG